MFFYPVLLNLINNLLFLILICTLWRQLSWLSGTQTQACMYRCKYKKELSYAGMQKLDFFPLYNHVLWVKIISYMSCLLVKWRIESTSLTAKSTSLGLLHMTLFHPVKDTPCKWYDREFAICYFNTNFHFCRNYHLGRMNSDRYRWLRRYMPRLWKREKKNLLKEKCCCLEERSACLYR